MHEILFQLDALLLAHVLDEIIGSSLADQGLAATGRAVEQKALRRRVFEALEKLGV